MNDSSQPSKRQQVLSDEIGRQEQRRLRAMRRLHEPIWLGFSVMGLIGWGVVVPALAGLALGAWLDSTHPGKHSWTLTLFAAGLLLGCFNAGYWVNKELNAIRADQDEKEDVQ